MTLFIIYLLVALAIALFKGLETMLAWMAACIVMFGPAFLIYWWVVN